jgi:hypothetical protein
MSYKKIIRQMAENLLKCDDDFLLMKQSVDQMYQIFSEITGVKIGQMS